MKSFKVILRLYVKETKITPIWNVQFVDEKKNGVVQAEKGLKEHYVILEMKLKQWNVRKQAVLRGKHCLKLERWQGPPNIDKLKAAWSCVDL